MEFEKVKCPACGRTITHYIKGSGTNSVYRSGCPKCGKTVIIFSAGKTVLANEKTYFETTIEIKIEY
jgi:ribosomal protein S27E